MSKQIIEVQLQEPQNNWADHARLAVDLLGPLMAAVFGIWVVRLTKRIEQNQWRNQKLIEKRILIWDQVGPLVNAIYCYCKRIGPWKEMTPQDVIMKKRAADQAVHLSRPFFSEKFFAFYVNFISCSFSMYQGLGADAKIKTPVWEHRIGRPTWDDHWDTFFDDRLDEAALVKSYEEMLRQVQAEIVSS